MKKMEVKTSSQAYDEYQRLSKLEDKLKKANRGLSIVNSKEFFESKKYFLKIIKVSKMNLEGEKSKIVIDTNFPFSDWRYRYGEMSIEGFLDELKKWVIMPRYEMFVNYNRKKDNIPSWWNLPKFHTLILKFEDIVLEIGEEAQHDINLKGFNFVEEVKKLLSMQREATEDESKDFERYGLLLELIKNLKRHLDKDRSTEYYGSCNNRVDNRTLKFTIDKKTYNKKLEIIEKELLKICKKYSYLKMPDIDYQDIKKRLSLEDWKLHNKEEVEDDWGDLDDEEKEEYEGDFENYLKKGYIDYLDYNDFDE